jgi:biopolymer transport protein ExbD
MAASIGSEDGDMGFQIAPMVDVVFVLLLFFMASAGAQLIEKELSINLPSGSAFSDRSERVPIVIEISPDGQVTMNDQLFGNPTDKELAKLKDWFRSIMGEGSGSKDPVIIRPANDARQERVIDVLNACAAGGVKNVTFG